MIHQMYFDLKNDGISDADIKYLIKLAKQHRSLMEWECNKGLSDTEKNTEETVENTIRNICKKYGIGVRFDGDPRGWTVKLHLKSKKYNTWGGEETGYGIGEES